MQVAFSRCGNSWLLATLLALSCSAPAVRPNTKESKTTQELGKIERQKFRLEASANYPTYRNLRVSFSLKGKVDNQELYYVGDLEANPVGLKIKLTDAIFLSPLMTLEIGQQKVTLKDHARNKTESIARADYQWVELFGRSFPVRFFEPLMRGYLPDDAFLPQSMLERTAGGEILSRIADDSFEAALYFYEAKLHKIFYRDKMRGEILIFELANFFKERVYPRKLRIEHSRQNDFLQLDFKNLRVG